MHFSYDANLKVPPVIQQEFRNSNVEQDLGGGKRHVALHSYSNYRHVYAFIDRFWIPITVCHNFKSTNVETFFADNLKFKTKQSSNRTHLNNRTHLTANLHSITFEGKMRSDQLSQTNFVALVA